MCTRNYTVEDWFDFEAETPPEPCWPFSNITYDEYYHITESARHIEALSWVTQLIMFIFCPIGVVGSLLCALTMWRKCYHEKCAFFRWMFAIAILDIIFNVLYIPYSLNENALIESVYAHSYTAMSIVVRLSGVLYALSSASDLCTLGLTVYRYLSICWPTKGLQTKMATSKVWRGCIGLIIVLISSTRLHFSFEYTVIAVETPRDPNDTEDANVHYKGMSRDLGSNATFLGLVFFSDILLPFFMLSLMIFFSLQIALTLIARWLKRKRQTVRKQHMEMKKRDEGMQKKRSVTNFVSRISMISFLHRYHTASILSLLVILMFLFMLNQIGYALYGAGYILRRMQGEVTLNSSREHIRKFVDSLYFHELSIFLSTVFECLAHSLNFFLYMLFSSAMREEFAKLIRKNENRFLRA